MQVVGCGALNLDRLYKVSSRASRDEEVAITEVVEAPGGSAANTIYALGVMGLSTGFLGAMGNDTEGKTVLDSLNTAGVDTSRIRIVPDARTGLVIGIVAEDGERSLYIASGANDRLSENDIDWVYLQRTEFVHMSSFVSRKQFDIQKKISEFLAGTDCKVSFAPGSLYAKRGISELLPIIKDTHIVFLNEEEARLLSGKDYEEAAGFLLEKGCRIVAITLKDKGCYVSDDNSSKLVEAQQAHVVDTTGAGDAFCAGFLYGLFEGRNIEECAAVGNYVAARCISKIGARSGLPTIHELKESLPEIF